jgi:hypothetical protein
MSGRNTALLTMWLTPAEVLPRKLASPLYCAVSVLDPTVVSVSEHVPAATVPMHEFTPSLTVINPVGVPLVDVTVKVTATARPTIDGSGLSDVIVVVVAHFTKTRRTDSAIDPEPSYCPVP